MKKNIFILLAISFLVISCKEIIDSAGSIGIEKLKKEDLKTIKVNNRYSISVPKYMKEMKTLNEDASFQYANIIKETYTIVIDEDKQEFIDAFKEIEIYNDSLTPLKNYVDFQIQSLEEGLENEQIKELDFKIRNLQAQQYEVKGIVDNFNAAYLISYIEDKDRMFMIMSWTTKKRYKKYKNTFKIIHDSFKLKK